MSIPQIEARHGLITIIGFEFVLEFLGETGERQLCRGSRVQTDFKSHWSWLRQIICPIDDVLRDSGSESIFFNALSFILVPKLATIQTFTGRHASLSVCRIQTSN